MVKYSAQTRVQLTTPGFLVSFEGKLKDAASEEQKARKPNTNTNRGHLLTVGRVVDSLSVMTLDEAQFFGSPSPTSYFVQTIEQRGRSCTGLTVEGGYPRPRGQFLCRESQITRKKPIRRLAEAGYACFEHAVLPASMSVRLISTRAATQIPVTTTAMKTAMAARSPHASSTRETIHPIAAIPQPPKINGPKAESRRLRANILRKKQYRRGKLFQSTQYRA